MAGALSRRAAQYLRVSSDQQRYSLAGQSAQVAAYAERHGFQIVRTYQDAGVSGVTTVGRKGLRALLADVVGGQADYDTVLVYDVSRWGRFQNPDEAAHYEFVCRQEGVAIVYCAEPFEEGGVSAALLKQVKRVMAAEYSRHLSRTVAGAKRRYAGAGCWQGGAPAYGLRRALIGADGQVERVLESGQRKPAGGSYRVGLVLGPPEEQALIRRIYGLFVDERLSRSAIVRRLCAEQVPYSAGKPWTYQGVHNVLTNPIYVGRQVFGRTVRPLGAPKRRRAQEDWVTTDGMATAVVSQERQDAAARLIAQRANRLSDRQVLARLKSLARREGLLTSQIILAAGNLPVPAGFRKRFGSLKAAYALIGYDHKAARAERKAARAEQRPAVSRTTDRR